MRKPVTFCLKSDRLARVGEEVFTIPKGTVLTGELELERSDGLTGGRDFQEPSFLRTLFDFEFGGRRFRDNGFLSFWHLWAPNGTQVAFEDPTFVSDCGVIDGMMDAREEWFYIRPDGVRHSNRLKYTSCHLELMIKAESVQVKCRYYDQNENIAGYVTIHYELDLDDIILMRDLKYYYDADGKVEDWSWEGEPYVTLAESGGGEQAKA